MIVDGSGYVICLIGRDDWARSFCLQVGQIRENLDTHLLGLGTGLVLSWRALSGVESGRGQKGSKCYLHG